MLYQDPLYGQIQINEKQLKLFQTPALTRLRDVSLSAVPPLATPSGIIASRFEHSVGVSYLANLLTKQKHFAPISLDLYLAALFHDTGSPPFSHASEIFLTDLTSKSHEEFVENIIFNPENLRAIKLYGGNPKIVFNLIIGKYKPWSDLINSTIDLDNIDNSLRWGRGSGTFQNMLYEPEHLINAYTFHHSNLSLKSEYYSEIQKWELCRRLVYEAVYSDSNLGPATVLIRALEYAYQAQELTKDFFHLTESQALYTLENRCNLTTQKLIKDLKNWVFYPLVGSIVQKDQPTEKILALVKSWKAQQVLADSLADQLKIPRAAVTLYAGRDKGFKKIHLPFIGDSTIEKHQPFQNLFWRVKVYAHPKYYKHRHVMQKNLDAQLC